MAAASDDTRLTSTDIKYPEKALIGFSSIGVSPWTTLAFGNVIKIFNPNKKATFRTGENRASLNCSNKGRGCLITTLHTSEEYTITKKQAQNAVGFGKYGAIVKAFETIGDTNELTTLLLYPCYEKECNYPTLTYQIIDTIRSSGGGEPWTSLTPDQQTAAQELVDGYSIIIEDKIKWEKDFTKRLANLKKGGYKKRKTNKKRRRTNKSKKSRKSRKRVHRVKRRNTRNTRKHKRRHHRRR